MGERRPDQVKIAKVISTTGIHGNKIKNFHSKLRILARILLSCVNNRKPTNSSDYMNID